MYSLPTPRARLAAAALALACGLFAAFAPAGRAIVPPADCGIVKVDGKRYAVKADQLRCRTAKPHASRYLSTHRRPSGYTCRDFSRATKLKFRCSRGIKVFFAIRR